MKINFSLLEMRVWRGLNWIQKNFYWKSLLIYTLSLKKINWSIKKFVSILRLSFPIFLQNSRLCKFFFFKKIRCNCFCEDSLPFYYDSMILKDWTIKVGESERFFFHLSKDENSEKKYFVGSFFPKIQNKIKFF